jgi:diadenosine tetraphosphate (Ap4A) HIT family hydrolase
MTLIHERVALAREGRNALVIGRMRSGWAVLGDVQLPLGYCLLLADPVVGSINELTGAERAQFLSDMVLVGDALLALTSAYRINYELQGNTEQALHAHIFARYREEGAERRKGPVWFYGAERSAVPFDAGLHGSLQRELAGWLAQQGGLSAAP